MVKTIRKFSYSPIVNKIRFENKLKNKIIWFKTKKEMFSRVVYTKTKNVCSSSLRFLKRQFVKANFLISYFINFISWLVL